MPTLLPHHKSLLWKSGNIFLINVIKYLLLEKSVEEQISTKIKRRNFNYLLSKLIKDTVTNILTYQSQRVKLNASMSIGLFCLLSEVSQSKAKWLGTLMI